MVGLAPGALANGAVRLAVALSLEWRYFFHTLFYVASQEGTIFALGSDGFAFLVIFG